MTVRVILAVIAAYLLGAIPTSYIVVRAIKGVDLRMIGSGNLGATNVYRQLGFPIAVGVGMFDTAKGAIPVALFAPWAGLGTIGAALLGCVAVAGHAFSVFVGFKGGKGVATGGGVVLGLAPWAFVVAVVVWAVTMRWSGFASLASIVAAVVLPPALWLLHPERRDAIALVCLLSIAVIWFHRGNIRRLRDGTEQRVRKRPERASNGATP